MQRRYPLYNIVLGAFAILFLVGTALIYFAVTQHRQDLFQAAIGEKVKLAEMVKETVASPSWLYRITLLQDMEKGFIAGLSRFEDISFIRIVKADGEIYQSTFEEEVGQRIKDDDIVRVIQSGKFTIRDETFRGQDLKLIIYPGYENQTIWVGFSLAKTQALAEKLLWRYVPLALLVFLTLAAVLMFILKNVVDPIRSITAVCEEARKGNLDVKAETNQPTEIGELAGAFNKMLIDLKESRRGLEEARKILEIRVAARTRELEELTEGLESQVRERTKDLQVKMTELERFNRLAVGRELKMIELKKEIKKLR
jgi:HAMP domain-containing protein